MDRIEESMWYQKDRGEDTVFKIVIQEEWVYSQKLILRGRSSNIKEKKQTKRKPPNWNGILWHFVVQYCE